MSGVLHLSDLHLGKPGDHQWLDDHKASIAGSDRRAERDVLRETITAFADDGGLDKVEAVVVSGDLTNRGGSDGFDEFAELMQLITAHVAPEKILVVPGNHDVPREHGPGDPERYTEFLRVTREQGFVTPLLDGVDFDDGGALSGQGGERQHLVYGKRFAIVPINSSHFCWCVEPLPDSIFEELLSVDPDKISEATKALRRHDIPRVSNAQMTALERLIGRLDAWPDPGGSVHSL
jgi:3',5'-cyclic AMP phosphodiesterase CpdA